MTLHRLIPTRAPITDRSGVLRLKALFWYRCGGGRLVQIGGSSEDLTLSLALRSCSDAGEGTGR